MKHILLAATALAMLSGAAYAQSSTSGSASTTTVNTQSGSTSQSVSNPRVNVIGNPIGNGASSSYSGSRSASNSHSNSRSAAVGNTTNVTIDTYAGVQGSGNSRSASASRGAGSTGTGGGGSTGTTGATDPAGDPTYGVNYSGSYTVRNTPEVIPPNVVGGNPCSVGASGGMALAGFGIAAGGTWADRQCERRQQAALLFNIGKQKAAVALMCQDDNVRNALRMAGEGCPADIAAAAPPPVAAAPVPVAAAPAAPAARVMPVAAKPARPDWCDTASAAELRRHSECDIRS